MEKKEMKILESSIKSVSIQNEDVKLERHRKLSEPK